MTVTAEFFGFQDSQFEIATDLMRFKQVLLNYQSNAIKFTPDGGKIAVECTLKKESEEDPGVI